MAISIEINLSDFNGIIGGLDERLKDMTPAMEEIGDLAVSGIKTSFMLGESPDGTKWAPSKRVRLAGGQSAVDIGTMRRSQKSGSAQTMISGRANGLMNSHVYEAEARSVTIGTNVVYARPLYLGAKKGSFGTFAVNVRAHNRRGKSVREHTRNQALPWGDIPARNPLGIRTEDYEEIADILGGYLVGND